jgi:hypothetical protein
MTLDSSDFNVYFQKIHSSQFRTLLQQPWILLEDFVNISHKTHMPQGLYHLKDHGYNFPKGTGFEHMDKREHVF